MAMTLRLTKEESRRLSELGAAGGRAGQDRRSGQEATRGAVAERWSRQRRDQRIDEVMGRVLPRYRGLLDRLGSA